MTYLEKIYEERNDFLGGIYPIKLERPEPKPIFLAPGMNERSPEEIKKFINYLNSRYEKIEENN